MLDLSFFRRPTYLGANVAAVALAAALSTMLTYLNTYLEGGLGLPPRTAGLYMLPIVAPVFLTPRLVAPHLAHRLSGRSLLTLGLSLISMGLLWMGIEAPRLRVFQLVVGMLMAGMGAGILNSETAKVGMTVIPPERAGMASGVVGTVRFTGIVVGYAALSVRSYIARSQRACRRRPRVRLSTVATCSFNTSSPGTFRRRTRHCEVPTRPGVGPVELRARLSRHHAVRGCIRRNVGAGDLDARAGFGHGPGTAVRVVLGRVPDLERWVNSPGGMKPTIATRMRRLENVVFGFARRREPDE